ncbi:hypothetical protein P7C70_g3599, partial [Phenoliferia sp. Uapishka_3]
MYSTLPTAPEAPLDAAELVEDADTFDDDRAELELAFALKAFETDAEVERATEDEEGFADAEDDFADAEDDFADEGEGAFEDEADEDLALDEEDEMTLGWNRLCVNVSYSFAGEGQSCGPFLKTRISSSQRAPGENQSWIRRRKCIGGKEECGECGRLIRLDGGSKWQQVSGGEQQEGSLQRRAEVLPLANSQSRVATKTHHPELNDFLMR